ncbi:ABC transporter ATP-binding protein [Danxiaibacter flavus]|uniref:ABC transporter ATP-binding protein n=1 Tax=Danxiaibacter flavus TaxID=3049108 RepID=A0ABV3ZQ04_9BACT|nr:ABC transporter ATP-binding protein [Chitinophagaceae bacterium DXS]
MKPFLFYLKPYKVYILTSLLLGAIYQILVLLDPHFIGIIIDKFAVHPHSYGHYDDKKEFVAQGLRSREYFIKGILLYLGIIAGITVVSRISKAFQEYMISIVVQKAGASLFADGIKNILNLPYQEFEYIRSGEIISLLQNAKDNFETLLGACLNTLYGTIISLCFVTFYSINIHWSILPVFFGGVATISFISKKVTRVTRKLSQRTLDQLTSLAGSTTESLRNIEFIKSTGISQQQVKQFHENTDAILKLKIQKIKQVRMLNFLQGASINLFQQSLMFMLLVLIYEGELTVGKLLTISLYSIYIFAPLYDVGKIGVFYRDAQTSKSKLSQMLEPKSKPGTNDLLPMSAIEELRFSSVFFRHEGDLSDALSEVSFEVKTGETIAFVGPSGSGKSTLAKLLTGLYRPSSGSIFYNNVDSRNINLDSVQKLIGVVNQQSQLFSGTIKENLLLFCPTATDQMILDVLHLAACDELLKRSDKGIETVLGEAGVRISGGERQRICIARALIRDPDLLLFDEATSSLDYLTEAEINSTLKSLSKERSIITIIIAHRLSTITHADRVYVLENGAIVEKGDHSTLVNQKGLYYAMWRQQVGESKAMHNGSGI